MTKNLLSGLGERNARLKVYIANRPDYGFADNKYGMRVLAGQEIAYIGRACGNGWRKVFNVYAKLVFTLPHASGFRQDAQSWQQYRDSYLLQAGSDTALCFNAPDVSDPAGLHIVMGRTYAKSLMLGDGLEWINPEFAIDREHRLIVCPYFDYRQLSNSKILFLSDLIQGVFF
ncbi:DUF6942 family protein [Lacimicrobium alkaliphilum]|uniref:Uncharacterized protein n=1 Tax=Lacimicrobium alkaliphilum TaxID=1526571 RepID=A0ABQ1RCK1_9ALTE|nr:hypothetical protein [Lacimicrobium alkaliphilum]GGD63877.1 hypothetical protein GCM10011357_19050 [Lacimicrobium alkaliphilum]